MNTEIFIEKYRLDVSADISTLLNFAIDDIKDFSSRSTTWSKTIVLPGTQNNNKLFGHIFQIGQANAYTSVLDNVGYNYNASKAADCIIFQDQMQTFKGVLRLMQINIIKGQIEYEVAVFGELAGLNVALSSGFLEDLDFSAYDHTYDETAIVASWNNTAGVDVYYPLIDYGTYSDVSKQNWDIRTFRPALHVREYIDKMMTAAGYRWSSALFDTARFKTLIVPHNQKNLTKLGSTLVLATSEDAGAYIFTDTGAPGTDEYVIPYDTFSATGFTLGGTTIIEYTDPTTKQVSVSAVITDGSVNVIQGGAVIQIAIVHERLGVRTILANQQLTSTPSTFQLDASAVEIEQNDFLYLLVYAEGGYSLPLEYSTTIDFVTLTVVAAGTTIVNVNPGDEVIINDSLPKNVRQIDFILGIVKLFNLYVYEDRFDSRLIYFTPYIDFYTTDSTDSIDWTYKLNREKALKIKPMSELNAKKYEFKFKPDSDFYNETYRKRYGKGYGDYIFDSEFEFAEQTKTSEIVFSATPLVGYSGEDKIYPTIFKQSNAAEERIDSNIRIMQSKKITGVTSWNILDGVSVLDSVTEYGYAGHFDDPDAPANDLNFGALQELFFTLVTGDLTVTQFNVYWSAYMAEITDKDSKLLTAHFYLTAKDILLLDFSKFVFIDGNLFRLNSIKDYNCSEPTDCEIELLKINFLIY